MRCFTFSKRQVATVFALFFLWSPMVLTAQNQGNIQEPPNNFQANAINNDGSVFPNQFTSRKMRTSVVKAEGSPFFKTKYTKGSIVVKGEVQDEAFMRFNAHLDHVEVKAGNRSYQLLKRDYIAAEIAGKMYYYTNYFDGNTEMKGYLIRLTEGEITFYIKPQKIFKSRRKAKTGYDVTEPARYIDMESYYLQKGKGPKVKVRLNKGTLKDLFGSQYENALDYARKHDLDRKDPYDLAAVIDWYNRTLIE